ncbi:hypothetical protein [Methylophaga sp. OBS1]|uniref:hypothetical protein n=1 Tax=Methylophaga sp. OBS1 TaxID=2991933 RepID=UPI002259038D|nr:hypothetical protein [Methylophaga sp. OBS1]MCX4192556.1 hypothetical protein [Methylophaga sp. OBS1]
MSVYFYLALLLSMGGSVLIYLGSRHQLWLSHQLPARPLQWMGFSLIGLSLILLLGEMQAVAAVFLVLIWVMLLLVLFPYLGAAKSLRNRNNG